MNSCALQEDEPRVAFTADPGVSGGLDLSIDLGRAVRLLSVVIATLVATATIVTIVTHRLEASNHHELAQLINRFDLGFEPSVPNWYSSVNLMACSILVAVIARAKETRRDRWVGSWRVMAFLFALLAVGKGVRLNEIVNRAVYSFVDSQERFYTPWVFAILDELGSSLGDTVCHCRFPVHSGKRWHGHDWRRGCGLLRQRLHLVLLCAGR
jgi:hypothetical protein